MLRMMSKIIWRQPLLIVMLMIFTLALYGQKSYQAYSYPHIFSPPKDYFASGRYLQYIQDSLYDINSSIKKLKLKEDKPWIVFSDRDKNPIYAADRKTVVMHLEFAKPCYVVNQDREWIEIVDASASGDKGLLQDVKYLGWVKKTEMLLWRESLTTADTRIHLKAFLLNKATDLRAVLEAPDKNLVSIYQNPTGTQETSNKHLYQFFFVFKEENDRYLVGGASELGAFSAKITLVGWLPKNRAVLWNTRLAFEPNFLLEAFEERNGSGQKYRVTMYSSAEAAKLVAQLGSVNKDNAWDSDLMTTKGQKLASPKDPKRFRGSVIRFPMLSEDRALDRNIIRTGVVGDIVILQADGKLDAMTLEDFNKVVDEVKEVKGDYAKFNILFVVEGTQSMAEYKPQLMNIYEECEKILREEFRNNIRIGMAVYRGTANQSTGRDFEILPLTARKEEFTQFLESTHFLNWNHESEYMNLHYAVKQGIEEAGFKAGQMNVIIVVGKGPDFSTNPLLRRSDANRYAMVANADLVDYLAQIDASIFFLQCQGGTEKFAEDADNIILELGKDQYNKTASARASGIFQIQPPSMKRNAKDGLIELKNGAIPGFVYSLSGTGKISGQQLKKMINNAITRTQEYADIRIKILSSLFEKGDVLDVPDSGEEFAAGSFEAIVAKELQHIINRSGLSVDNLPALTGKKYQIFYEMFLPFQVKGANHPAVSTVLFMTEADLDRHIASLEKIREVEQESTIDKKRVALFDMYFNILQSILGNSITRESVKSMSERDFIALVNSVRAEGLRDQDTHQRFAKLGDILDSRRTSVEEINNHIRRLAEKYNKLREIKTRPKDHGFNYDILNESRYFWIKLDEAF